MAFYTCSFKRLSTRLQVFLLVPVFLLTIGGGLLSFIYTRNLLLKQWNEAAVLRLARAAHDIDMRLTTPLNLLNTMFEAKGHQKISGPDLVSLLKNMDGVVEASFLKEPDSGEGKTTLQRGGMHGGMGFHRSRIADVSPPVYDSVLAVQTVSMTVLLYDRDKQPLGRLIIQMGFDYLLRDVTALGWWQSDAACLITRDGVFLSHTNMEMDGRTVMGEDGDPLEQRILERVAAARSGTVTSGERPPARVAGFHLLDQVPWALVMFGRGDAVLQPIILYRNLFLGGCLIMAAGILLLIRLNTGRLVRDIGMISENAVQVAQGQYPEPLSVHGADEISRLKESYNAMVAGLKERDFIRDSFGRYVDPEFARQLMARPDAGRLGGERREVAILMSDLRGFTPLSEAHPPEVIIEVLNLYFSRMIGLIQAHQGIIVDFFGDAVLAFFDPLDGPVGQMADQALACANAMLAAMPNVNQDVLALDLPALHMGIGLHRGPVVVGNIGSAARAKYGIVGSAVNITSRIQAKAGKGEIIATRSFMDCLSERPPVLSTLEMPLKGIAEPMQVHRIRYDTPGD